MTINDNSHRHLSFNEKEAAVTWFFMTGMSLKQIGEWSGIPEKSVSYYKRRVMRKIGVNNNNEFIIWFLKADTIFQCEAAEQIIPRCREPAP
ncbi:helix-turn-helix transcriptional regulator [Cronobacter dublinensis]